MLRIGAKSGEQRVVMEGAVELLGVGIDQQLGRIEPQAVVGGVDAVGAVAVAGALLETVDEEAMNMVIASCHGQTGEFPVVGIEQAEFDLTGMVRPDGEIDAGVEDNRSALPRLFPRHVAPVRL
jgi:hypothetical protein